MLLVTIGFSISELPALVNAAVLAPRTWNGALLSVNKRPFFLILKSYKALCLGGDCVLWLTDAFWSDSNSLSATFTFLGSLRSCDTFLLY